MNELNKPTLVKAKKNSRGKLIFPCGSGKSLTGFWMMEKLNASYIRVTDDSHHHAGHHGINQVGNTHFSMIIVSKRFEGQSSLQRHRRH